ncbi:MULTISPECIES: VOC family protein [Aeromonas]|jgi:predicted enzyme related to lactoylglutathione lyase|uniref:VOC family protein n=1 Tax=Aeromonas media TaxID=651 RepID=A0ABX6NWN1_AERME|nr:VOC family protein [Aeromonas media]MBL0512068.1 VOC family protein [Aeromonas media]MDM5075988.1 VOC family protein [Aeromonas media]QJT34661.1 VOC family protein [Aeromonas media]QJT40236.1 VOC family protein [Aeromonas media]WOQ11517.1 VOC family protein [Aeromonas media]
MAEPDMAREHALAEGSTFTWHELYVPDGEAGIRFYTEVLGWESQLMEMEGGNYPMLVVNGRPVAGVQSTRDNPQMAGVPPHWATYIAVDDVDARLAKVTRHGGSLVVPAMDIPTVGRMALIADPQGAHIWLFTPFPGDCQQP